MSPVDRAILVVVIIFAVLLLQVALVYFGHPTAVWLWCSPTGVC